MEDVATPIVVVRQPGRRPVHLAIVGPIELGRDCDGLLLVDSQTSRRHLQLAPSAGGVVATDLGSTNGTFLGDRRLDEPVLLEAGRALRLGDTIVELHVAETGPTPTGGFDPRATSIDLVAAAIDRERPDLSRLGGDSGTVTIVFSDIESSTERTVAHGDAEWFAVLGEHDRIVGRQVAAHDGTVVKHQGDGFMLTFPSARRAVTCMISVQRALAAWAEREPERAVRVRMGAHTGEAIDEGGDLFCRHVILAARIGNEAEGGQILVSSMVHDLVAPRGDLP
ncbi:MAG: adenylate/guanylate cyclase domain-containing protein, partial [Actinomycetota bacterium]